MVDTVLNRRVVVEGHCITDDCVENARKGLAIYFTILIVLTALFEWRLVSYGDSISNHLPVVVMLMWTPAVASIITRLVRREGFGDVSFRLPARSARFTFLIAWLFTVVVAAIAYGVAWLTGLVRFTPIYPHIFGLENSSPAVGFISYLVVGLIVGVLVSALLVTGEEIGWRGYMLTRLIDAKIPRPVLLSALIWSLWHIPLVLSGIYTTGSSRLLSAGLFLVNGIPIGFLIAWLRLSSGSIWPSILFHASWNTVIETVFDRATVGNNIWVGESGILVTVLCILLVYLLLRSRPEVDDSYALIRQRSS
jgi:uncharacterized protein